MATTNKIGDIELQGAYNRMKAMLCLPDGVKIVAHQPAMSFDSEPRVSIHFNSFDDLTKWAAAFSNKAESRGYEDGKKNALTILQSSARGLFTNIFGVELK
jgi:hypothetical protein